MFRDYLGLKINMIIYPAGSRDVQLALACAASGALLLIHDIETCWQPPGHWTSGPREAFAYAAEGRESWTYLDPEEMRWGHGIGVVQL